MRLQFVTRDPDPLVRELLKLQGSDAQREVLVMDITGGQVDYPALVDAIFAATEIQVF